MKQILVIAMLAGSILIGCQAQPQPNITINQQPQPHMMAPAPTPPPVPNVQPVVPPVVSSRFLKGYNDGFFGTWLAPLRWAVVDDYRNGWSLGSYDRSNKLPNRYIK